MCQQPPRRFAIRSVTCIWPHLFCSVSGDTSLCVSDNNITETYVIRAEWGGGARAIVPVLKKERSTEVVYVAFDLTEMMQQEWNLDTRGLLDNVETQVYVQVMSKMQLPGVKSQSEADYKPFFHLIKIHHEYYAYDCKFVN